jgi:hypothetical protein
VLDTRGNPEAKAEPCVAKARWLVRCRRVAEAARAYSAARSLAGSSRSLSFKGPSFLSGSLVAANRGWSGTGRADDKPDDRRCIPARRAGEHRASRCITGRSAPPVRRRGGRNECTSRHCCAGSSRGRDTDEVIESCSLSTPPAGYRFPREVIAVAVRWYLRYGLSYRGRRGVARRTRHQGGSRDGLPVGADLHRRVHRRRSSVPATT